MAYLVIYCTFVRVPAKKALSLMWSAKLDGTRGPVLNETRGNAGSCY
jgi:hypothetical protein